MSQAPEHHVRHLINLKLNGIIYIGIIVAMYHAPPGAHPVNDAHSIREIKIHPLCTLYMVCWDLVWDIGIRVPDMIFFNIH